MKSLFYISEKALQNRKKTGRALLVAKPWKGGLGHYFFHALQDFFKDVEWFATYPVKFSDKISYRSGKIRWRQRLAERIDSARYDVAFFINTLSEFSGLTNSDKHILWITDDPRPVSGCLDAFGQVYLADAGYEKDITPHLRKGQFGGVLSFAHLPEIHTPYKKGNVKNGICFIANRDPKRNAFLKALFTQSLYTKVYGNYFFKDSLFWSHPFNFLPSVPNSKMGKVYSRFSISVNIHAQVVRQGTNMRTFECAGYGVPQFVEYRPGLTDYFEPDREIIVFSSVDDMVEKLNAHSQNKNALNIMANNARKRALEEHTYHHRINTLINGI